MTRDLPAGGGVPAPRRYGDREVARILERAAELQRAEPSAANPAGLTLDELAEIAREAGIHPDLLRRAAAEETSGASGASLGSRLAGAPVTLRLERSIPGELPPERFDAIIPRIQQGTEAQGTASVVGRTLTWSSRSDDRRSSQQVIVSSHHGTTLIRWEERFTVLAATLFGGIVGGGGGGIGLGAGTAIAGAAGSLALAIGLPVVALGGCYAIARAVFTRMVRRRERTALQTIDEIARYVRQVQPESGRLAAAGYRSDEDPRGDGAAD